MVAEVGKLYVAAFEAPGDEVVDSLATEFFAEDHEQRFLGEDGLAEFRLASVESAGEPVQVAGIEVELGLGLARELDRLGVCDIKTGAIETHIGAKEPGEEWMLDARIAAYKENCAGGGNIAEAGGFAWMAA